MTKEELNIKKDELFYVYYKKWVKMYKEGAVRNVTMQKYIITMSWIKRLVPDLKTSEFNRMIYQQLLNDYAVTHEKQTTMDFHHQLKGSILDAVDDGIIAIDPTRKVIIKGKAP